MTKKADSRDYWYERGQKDASDEKYNPPAGSWFSFINERPDSGSRDAYNQGYYDRPSDASRRFDVRGAYLRRTDLSFANLEGANLSGADFSNANLRGANFANASLQGTILKGADLSEATNLTPAQLRTAILDETTKLPKELALGEILGR
jgi:uncharacterized protein YjbI with pentapeptide repeats